MHARRRLRGTGEGTSSGSVPAWRLPIVWLMVGLPASAVVAGLITLWIAVRGHDPLIDASLRRENLVWKVPAEPPLPESRTAP